MTSIWGAAVEVGDELRKSPHVSELRERMLRARSTPGAGHQAPDWLRLFGHVLAIGNFRYESSPLSLYTQLHLGSRFNSDFLSAPEAHEFLSRIQKVNVAAEILLEWVRSRLPGYPTLRVPQISEGAIRSQRATLDPRWPWLPDGRRHGLQLQDVPRRLLDLLELRGEDLLNGLRRLAIAFGQCAESVEFARLSRELSEDDRSSLGAIRRTLRENASAEKLHAVAGTAFRNHDRYRRATIATLLKGAPDRVRLLCSAFDRVDDVLEDVMAIIGYRSIFGNVTTVENTSRLIRYEIATREGSIRCSDPRFMFGPTNVVVLPPDIGAGLGDPFVVLGINMSYPPLDIRMFGRRLPAPRETFGSPVGPDDVPWSSSERNNSAAGSVRLTFSVGDSPQRHKVRGLGINR